MQKKAAAKRSSVRSAKSLYIKQGLTIVLLSLVLCGILMSVAVLLITKVHTAHKLFMTITTVVLSLSIFLSSFLMLKRYKENGFVLGAASGAVLFLLLMLASSIANGGLFSLQALVKFAVCVCSGSLGGILGANAATKVRKRKR